MNNQKLNVFLFISISVLFAPILMYGVHAEELSFEKRIEAHKKIEQVLYRYRIWPETNQKPKPLFEDVVSRSTLERNVEDYIIESMLLESFWQRPITGEQLQAEFDRIVSNSKDTEKLNEIFAVLNNDPLIIAECLARPLLAQRLIRSWYAYESSIHDVQKQEVLDIKITLTPETFHRADEGDYREINFSLIDSDQHGNSTIHQKNISGIQWLDSEEFKRISSLFPTQSDTITFDETREAFILRTTLRRDEASLRGAIRVFQKRSFDDWFEEMKTTVDISQFSYPKYTYTMMQTKSILGQFQPDSWATDPYVPYARRDHTAVWTGTEMIIWGGLLETYTGGRYSPVTDSWLPTSITNVPGSRYDHNAVWTGNEMLIWGGDSYGGYKNSGGRYDPVNDIWTDMTLTNAPSPRYQSSAIWTGNEMIIWGGFGCSDPPACTSEYYLNTGGRYNPSLDSWTSIDVTNAPSRRYYHSGVWTGNEMIVWGGSFGMTRYNNGSRYNPTLDDLGLNPWTSIVTTGAPSGRSHHTAVWTGNEMIVWGGYDSDETATGSRYNPDLQDAGYIPWIATDTASSNCPTSRDYHTAVWTGTEMLIWGGRNSSVYYNTGAAFNPVEDDLGLNPWHTITTSDAPAIRSDHTVVWTGSEMIIWGGTNGMNFYSTGGRYNRSLSSWVPTSVSTAPGERYLHSSVWTGSNFIVWGGYDGNLVFNTGACYYPTFDCWINTSEINNPTARGTHTAVWTGSEMIIWGGADTSAELNTGSRYEPPPVDTWTTINPSGTLSPRQAHTALWAGSTYGMIVWGGFQSPDVYLNDGARYYESSVDAWSSLPAVPIEGRQYHSAVWTAKAYSSEMSYQMIVWGGYYTDGSQYWLNSGARYYAETDTWAPVTMLGAPTPRALHTAVWNGDQMIVWGGYNDTDYYNDGGRYFPNTADSWMTLSTVNAPSGRIVHTAITTGTEMIVWGGLSSSVFYDSGGRYDYATSLWTDLPVPPKTCARNFHTANWTGQEMLIWGGQLHSDLLIFYPNTNPTSSPRIINSSDTIVLGGTVDDLRLSHTLRTAWWEDVENSTGWTIEGDWHAVHAQNCSGVGDYRSPTKAWYFGDSSQCDYDGTTGTFSITSPEVSIKPSSASRPMFIFHYFLKTDALKGDEASVSVRLNGGSWVTVAKDEAHWNDQNDGAILDDDCQQWQTISLRLLDFYTSIPTGSLLEARFSFIRDNLSNDTSGWLLDDIGLGDPAGDGSNSQTTAPYHDRWDKALFEWDLNQDSIADNPDLNTPVWNIPETDLDTFGLGQPGVYTLTLTITDVLGLTDSDDITLTVVDGIAPEVSVVTPNGGESWAYTGDPLLPKYHRILWNSSDNFQISKTAISYSTDGGSLWTPIVDIENYSNLPSTDTPVIILTPGVVTSSIQMPNDVTIGDIDVTINITHTYDWDLIIKLIGPDSTEVILSNQNGDYGDNYIDTHFDDEALTPIASGTPPFTGEFIPDEALSAFDGKSASGTWTLEVEDVYPADGGQIDNWTIHFTVAPSQNYLWRMPTEAEATAAGQTFPSSDSLIQIEVEDSGGNSASDISDNLFYIVQPTTSNIKSLILWNSTRIESAYGTTEMNALSSKLEELAGHTRISGVVLDLSIAGINYNDWDNDPTNQTEANLVADQIYDYLYDPNIGQITTTYTNTQYIVLVGDDLQIPHYRMPDGTTIYPESSYPSEVSLDVSSSIGSALNQNYFLTDNYYSETNPENSTLAGEGLIYQNDMAIGRLTETPSQMIELINAFIASDGQVDVTDLSDSILVTGFEFFYDSGINIKNSYANSPYNKDTHCLLDDPDLGGTGDPCVNYPYYPADLETELFTSTHKIINVNTHANHYNWATPIGSPALLSTSDMAANPNSLSGKILYTSGCHSGLTVPETDPNPLDLPEEMAIKKVLAYIGNTGYGWGLRYGVGLTEKLLEKLTDEILINESISLGKALANAKRSYFLEERRYDVFDEKVVHELTLFGLPQTLVVTQSAKAQQTSSLPPPDGPDQACVDGICLTKKLNRGGETNAIPPGLTELELNFTFGSATYTAITTDDGHYYTLNNENSAEVGDALQPQFVYDSYLSGTTARSVVFSGGNYAEQTQVPSFDPVVGVPRSTNIDNGEGALPLLGSFTPRIQISYGTSGGSAQKSIGEVGYTTMIVHTGYYSNSLIEYLFDSMQFTVYYSNETDVDPPVITDPSPGSFHTLNGMTADFDVEVTDAGIGVFRVIVIYNDLRTEDWNSLDLAYNSGTDTWQGNHVLKGDITYYIQALDKAGNSRIILETHDDMDGDEPPQEYGSTTEEPKTFDITLLDTDTDGLFDAYEDLYPCLDKYVIDDGLDPDYDYLTNVDEFSLDTDPCQGDSDDGGDNDGSEYNNSRDPLLGSDDKRITIDVTKVGVTYTVDWNDSLGDNGIIDGYYFIYRSDTPFFDPTDLVYGPLPDAQKSQDDIDPACNPCYYKVWNYQLDTDPPIVNVVYPNTGSTSGMETVIIYGANFLPGATVEFCENYYATGVTVINDTTIECQTPTHNAGACDVIVTNQNGQDGSLPGGFTFQ